MKFNLLMFWHQHSTITKTEQIKLLGIKALELFVCLENGIFLATPKFRPISFFLFINFSKSKTLAIKIWNVQKNMNQH